ncbi:hypothetical protein [Pseudoalteromonas caenipelagi]|uniref:hypothetical protein n=1 Tax=Pseudoalteromonas caenipelagi TaxID=2726988 RepID=UPI001FE68424|nr:hypothetical protein [Pseudoalteromonas caenipelagi]
MKLTTLILLLFISCHTQAATHEANIKALFANYMSKYNHYLQSDELPKTPQLYTDTLMLMSTHSQPRVITQTQMNQQVQVFLSNLKADGVTHVKWGKIKVHFLDSNIALVSNVAERYTKEGKLHNKVGASYYVYLIDGQWKISAFAIHDAKNTLT